MFAINVRIANFADEMRKKQTIYTLLLLFSLCLLVACKDSRKHLVIGVSQCSEDVWRDKLNDELTMASYAYENIELRIVSANDDSERQMQQINDFIEQKADLIIVSPNQLSSISYAIDKAEKNGIPVILFDRKSDTDNYTAFIGADNYEMGYQIGKFVAQQMQERGNVLEIMGLKGSSPAIERHKGFVDAINEYPGIHLVDTLQGDWTEKSGRQAMEAWTRSNSSLKGEDKKSPYKGDLEGLFVFAQNDRMAAGARRVLPNVRYCGIDGLAVKDGGLEQVKRGDLVCTYIYPTGGDKVFELAMKILEGRSFERDNYLQSALVTKENASVLLMQAEEIERQTVNLKAIHKLASKYLNQYHLQRTIVLLLIILIILLVAFTAFYLWVRKTKTALSEEVQSQKAEIERINRMQTPFVRSLLAVCTEHLSETDFNVNQLADEMAMSRVALYRKVKQHTGMSAVDFIRSIRLEHARQLFDETDMNVSQVADQVGFATLQYFIKCFRREYGCTPNEYIKTRLTSQH